MQKSTTHWDDIRLFLALTRSGSARAAAASLDISHSTVTRRIDRLETDLAARLFDRDVGGYRLTSDGEALFSSAEQAEETILAAERHLHGRDNELSGDIRVTTSDIIATFLLMPDTAGFTRRYPEIDLEILISYDLYNLSRREADIAIRFMGNERRPPDPLIGRKLVTAASSYYATPDYLASNDPADPGSGARWIGWNDYEAFPDWVRDSPYPDVPVHCRFNDPMLQLAAARSGIGMVALPCFIGDVTPELQRIPGADRYFNYDIWLLSHPDLRDVARLRAFREFVGELFDKKRSLLTGDL